MLQNLMIVCVCEHVVGRDMDGCFMPMPTHPQRYCDLASLVISLMGRTVIHLYQIKFDTPLASVIVEFNNSFSARKDKKLYNMTDEEKLQYAGLTTSLPV